LIPGRRGYGSEQREGFILDHEFQRIGGGAGCAAFPCCYRIFGRGQEELARPAHLFPGSTARHAPVTGAFRAA